MRVITVAGPPSVGKTSVTVKAAAHLRAEGFRIAVVKFDCLSTADDEIYRRAGFPVVTGLAGSVCPDHFFVSNIDDCLQWAAGLGTEGLGADGLGVDMLIAESAGLCNRCSPHVQGALAVCVVDNLSGIHTPKKIGPMLKLADVVAVTKGDIVSQAEREVFAYNVRLANPRAHVLAFNGMTGQGAGELAFHMRSAPELTTLEGRRLRFPMPSAICPYCIGETCIGESHQRGNVRKMSFEGASA
jgi:Ni2+-binding GTPase involved in maturation of urease and hydrogenase